MPTSVAALCGRRRGAVFEPHPHSFVARRSECPVNVRSVKSLVSISTGGPRAQSKVPVHRARGIEFRLSYAIRLRLSYVHVYMVAAGDATDNASVPRAGFIDLGSIKGNIGDQNYALSPEVDLSKYRTVSIWCKRFSVNFGAAPLTADEAGARGQHADSTEN